MQDKSYTDPVGVFITGFLIGATTGLLLAPQNGKKTRDLLRKKALAAAKQFQNKYEDTKKKASDLKTRTRKAVKAAERELTD